MIGFVLGAILFANCVQSLRPRGRTIGHHPRRPAPRPRVPRPRDSPVAKAFIANEIVPDEISTPPMDVVQVTFPSGATVNLGNVLRARDVQEQPEVVQWTADPSKYYTLAMTDPDPPRRSDPYNRATVRSIIHVQLIML